MKKKKTLFIKINNFLNNYIINIKQNKSMILIFVLLFKKI